ncbi:MAG: DinB family protein [Methylovulum sp.]|nr:DinB family protein [Methylovulum sp.]
MNRIEHIRLMAAYNAWMNAKLYTAAGRLSDDELLADRGAFFGSIMGTLNHIVVGDTLWLKRFATHPGNHLSLEPIRQLQAPASLRQILFTDMVSLSERRDWLDTVIATWSQSLTEADLDHVLHYANMKGVAADKSFFSLVMHFFNHQTHHRGQITTLLSQRGIDVGVTDLLELIPNQMAD